MSFTLLFSMRIEEPYPAVIQPAFKNTIPITGPVQTWNHTATAITATGREVAIDFNALFTPVKTHGLLFRFYDVILKEDPRRGGLPETTEPNDGTWFYRRWVEPYEQERKAARRTRYEGLRRYLHERAEWLAGEEVVRLHLARYRVTKYLEQPEAEEVFFDERDIYFD